MLEAQLDKCYPAGFHLNVKVEAAPGVTVLYGASGAGKTLTLDCLAGFEQPDAGRIMLDGRILFDSGAGVSLPARHRHCGYVFQHDALFPHMTLRQNLNFAAEAVPPLERHRKVNDLLERFRLADAAGRRPLQLSGGQRRRGSVARALIRQPRMLLLDEPATGLDSALRDDLHTLLREIRAEYRIPILLVTHDLIECFSLADTLLIYADGRIIQSGPPLRLLEHPASRDAARILGLANLFPAEVLALNPERNTSRVRALGSEFRGQYLPGRLLGDRVWLCVPPEELRLHENPGENRVEAKLVRIWERPQSVRLEFDPELVVDVPRREYHPDQRRWWIEIPPQALRTAG